MDHFLLYSYLRCSTGLVDLNWVLKSTFFNKQPHKLATLEPQLKVEPPQPRGCHSSLSLARTLLGVDPGFLDFD